MCMCMCMLYGMAKTKRVQVLMEQSEFEALERIAHDRGTSIADLMREAARAQHLSPSNVLRRVAAAQRFLSQPDVALPDWKSLKREIEDRRDDRLP